MRRGRGWFRRGRRRRLRRCDAPQPLAACGTGNRVTVCSNPDRKTLEMGLCRGAQAEVLRNDPGNPSLLVRVGDTRYVIPRDVAGRMSVRPEN